MAESSTQLQPGLGAIGILARAGGLRFVDVHETRERGYLRERNVSR